MASLGKQIGALGAIAALVVALCVGILYFHVWAPPTPPPDLLAAATTTSPVFAGGATCVGCHETQYQLWRDSHHDLAMQPATDETVLGDFDNVTFEHFGVVSRFFKRDGRFFVTTDGPGGDLRDYEIAYTFGVTPLQQYLVPFPDGRLQVLQLCWDSRPAEAGGQRWFHLYPTEAMPAGDPLHWTGLRFNWNFMCAECHSTNLQKRFDAQRETYDTRWADIDVGCEACHGPGSRHNAWAQLRERGFEVQSGAASGLVVSFRDPKSHTWIMAPDANTAQRTAPRRDRREVDMCARCHSRRSAPLTAHYPYGRSLLETHTPNLLLPPLYYADGQIRDEVYVYGSFLQSRMYAKGVICRDCHDAHSLRVPGDTVDAVCAKCHRQTVYGSRDHHHHDPTKQGASCVACHMPSTPYMVVDPRRDHRLSSPRPDLTQTLSIPNACSACHTDKPLGWVQEAMARWYPKKKTDEAPHFAHAFAAADANDPRSAPALAALATNAEVPAIIRASALARLRSFPGPTTVETAAAVAADPDPLVRYGAARALDLAGGAAVIPPLLRLLGDGNPSVRLQAARALAPAHDQLADRDRGKLNDAIAEVKRAELLNADTATAHFNLGLLFSNLRNAQKAEEHYRKAVTLEPLLATAAANLADLLRATGRDAQGGKLLRRTIEAGAEDARLHLAMGLWLARQGDKTSALQSFAHAASLDPNDPYLAYVHGVALQSAGKNDDALRIWREASDRHPADRDLLVALLEAYHTRGEIKRVKAIATRLREFYPNSPDVIEILRRAAPSP